MPKKETTGKGLAGGELKNEQAAVNASATSQDETPKKEKKKAERRRRRRKRSDRRPAHHSCHTTRGCWPIQDGDDAKALAPNMGGLDDDNAQACRIIRILGIHRIKRLTFSTELAAHPRFHLHFTPTSASWLNLVERFFAEITEQRIRRGVFNSVADLERGCPGRC